MIHTSSAFIILTYDAISLLGCLASHTDTSRLYLSVNNKSIVFIFSASWGNNTARWAGRQSSPWADPTWLACNVSDVRNNNGRRAVSPPCLFHGRVLPPSGRRSAPGRSPSTPAWSAPTRSWPSSAAWPGSCCCVCCHRRTPSRTPYAAASLKSSPPKVTGDGQVCGNVSSACDWSLGSVFMSAGASSLNKETFVGRENNRIR